MSTERIEKTGVLTPKRVVDESRPVDAPLHNEFEWDDSIAGEKYREEQARHLIGDLIIVEETIAERRKEEYKFDRAFVSTGEQNHRFVSIHVALSNDEWRSNLLRDAKRDMQAFITKYHRLEELAKIIEDMNEELNKET